MSQHPIDEFFRQALENHNADFHDPDWREAEKYLANKQLRRHRKIRLLWICSLPVLLSLIAIWLYWQPAAIEPIAEKNHVPGSEQTDTGSKPGQLQVPAQKMKTVQRQEQSNILHPEIPLPQLRNETTVSSEEQSFSDEPDVPVRNEAVFNGAPEPQADNLPVSSKTDQQKDYTLTLFAEQTYSQPGILTFQDKKREAEEISGMKKLSFARRPFVAMPVDLPLLNSGLSAPAIRSGNLFAEVSLSAGVVLQKITGHGNREAGLEWMTAFTLQKKSTAASIGFGQFSASHEMQLSFDSIFDASFYDLLIYYDTITIYDTTLIDSNFLEFDIDTIVTVTADTTLIFVEDTDTAQFNKKIKSTGRYNEIPVLFHVRKQWLGGNWKFTGGAAYGWYSGQQFGVTDVEGNPYYFKPPPVISFTARIGAQYKLIHNWSWQVYAATRYVMHLRNENGLKNYLNHSAGVGIVYRF